MATLDQDDLDAIVAAVLAADVSGQTNAGSLGGAINITYQFQDAQFYRGVLPQYVSVYEIEGLTLDVAGDNLSDVTLLIGYANATDPYLSFSTLGTWTQAGGFVPDAGWVGQTLEGPLMVYVQPGGGFTGAFTGARLAFDFTFVAGHAASSPASLTLDLPAIPYLTAGESWPCWWLRDKTPLQGWVPWTEFHGTRAIHDYPTAITYNGSLIDTVTWASGKVWTYAYSGTRLTGITEA